MEDMPMKMPEVSGNFGLLRGISVMRMGEFN
jgi:hypothetical protein